MSSSSTPFRVGVLGTGNAAGLTLSQLGASPDVSIRAIAGRSEASSRAAAERFSIPRACRSLDELVRDPDIEAVYIALPISTHAHWAVKALRAGKHVLVEKPATATASELDAIEQAQNASGKIFMEGMMIRHHPQWHHVLKCIRDGSIGRVRSVQGALTRVPPNADDPEQPFNRRDLGWSVLLDNGCYMTSLARMVFEAEPSRVSALGETDPNYSTLVSASALMQFPSGTASFTISTRMRRLQRLNIIGSEGRIEVMLPVMQVGGQPSIVVIDSRDIVPPDNPREMVFENVAQFRLQMEAFARVARGLEPNIASLDEARNNMRSLDALAVSAGTDGAWVSLDEVPTVAESLRA